MRSKTFITFVFFSVVFPTAYADQVELEPIVIEKNIDDDLSQFSILDQTQLYIMPTKSLVEVLAYYPSIQLRTRSVFGVQSDLSIRGSNFEDDSVFINGVRIDDPQTAHFNLIMPLTSADVEHVALDAVSKEVTFATKPPKGESVNITSTYGEHALFRELVSCTFGVSKNANRISYEYTTSSGARQDTDVKMWNASFDSLYEGDRDTLELIFAATARDYGAGNFYTTAFPSQEEHIAQQLFIVTADTLFTQGTLKSSASFRRQTDKFILNRHNPSFFTNYHTSYVYGIDADFVTDSNLLFGLGVGREKITSTNLARRERNRHQVRAGFNLEDYGKLLFAGTIYLTHYDAFNWQKRFDSTIGWQFSDSLVSRLRFSYDWRAPSFTELYYQSPSNVGNESLKVQDNFNVELNTDFDIDERLHMHGALFFTHQHDTIDWVKNGANQAWQATNVGRIKSKGFECALRFAPATHLDSVTLGYAYLDVGEQNYYLFSKYAFNYLQHAFITQWRFKFGSYGINVLTDFSKPTGRDNYTKVDVVLKKRINARATFFIEGTNVFDAEYEELPGIEGDPSWFKCGIELMF